MEIAIGKAELAERLSVFNDEEVFEFVTELLDECGSIPLEQKLFLHLKSRGAAPGYHEKGCKEETPLHPGGFVEKDAESDEQLGFDFAKAFKPSEEDLKVARDVANDFVKGFNKSVNDFFKNFPSK